MAASPWRVAVSAPGGLAVQTVAPCQPQWPPVPSRVNNLGAVPGRVNNLGAAPGRVDGLSFLAYAAGGDTNGRLGRTKRVSRRRPSPDAAKSLFDDGQAMRMRG